MINWTYVLVAFSAGGLFGMLFMSWLAMSGRQADQEWHEIEVKEAFERGRQEGIYQETLRQRYLLGDGVSHEQA